MKLSQKIAIGLSALAVFLTLPFSALAATAPTVQTAPAQMKVADFKDVVSSHVNYTAIQYWHQVGAVDGNADGTFQPEMLINRAAVLKIILKGAGVDAPEKFGESTFPDVPKDAWFARYVMAAKGIGIVKGNEKDGTFAPTRNVTKAEFIKMLLEAHRIQKTALAGLKKQASDVPDDAWFAPYMNYALTVGILGKNDKGLAEPAKAMTRADVMEAMYLLQLIRGSKATQFLLDRAQAEISQIEVYVAAKNIGAAKKASELAIDLTGQALKNAPDNKVALSASKLSQAYDYLVNAFILAAQKKYDEATATANKAIATATEAWEANHDVQQSARHIKDRANGILVQLVQIEAAR